MNEKLFEQLIVSLCWANDVAAGQPLTGGRITTLEIVDAERARAATGSNVIERAPKAVSKPPLSHSPHGG